MSIKDLIIERAEKKMSSMTQLLRSNFLKETEKQNYVTFGQQARNKLYTYTGNQCCGSGSISGCGYFIKDSTIFLYKVHFLYYLKMVPYSLHTRFLIN
jgi:hypothetical protein